MHRFPLAALVGWMPVGIYLFYRYPARVAILANFLAGWAVLPGARYAPTTESFPYWFMGVCLPTNYLLTKASVTGLVGLLGIFTFHSSDLKRFRPGIYDLPMIVWCCVPLLSAAARWKALDEGLSEAAYQTVSWGVPWLLGRIYFSDGDSLLMAVRAFVIAGICYVPICLVELCAGPQLYAFMYGYQPYRWVGATRYVGFRPIGMLEDGNQLGIWMAASTLVAIYLFARRPNSRILGLPPGWVAAGLAVTTVLCQSAGSILLLLLLLPFPLLKGRSVLRGTVVVLVLAILGFALLRMTNLMPLRALAQRNGAVHSIKAALAKIGRQSFAWRLAREESQVTVALRKPLLGFGKWNWWQTGGARPWGLWLLVFGMYGVVGLTAFASILIFPAIRAAWPPARSTVTDEDSLKLTLAALILMVAIDSLLNGTMILPYLLVMSGLTTSAGRATESKSNSRSSGTCSLACTT